MIIRLPADLPRFLALLAASTILALGYAGVWAEAAIGRPSSTSGLAIVVIPIWAALFAGVAFLVGCLLRALVTARGGRRPSASARPARFLDIQAGSKAVQRSPELPAVAVDDTEVVFEIAGHRSVPLRLPGLDSVRSVYATPLMRDGATRAFVAVINGRATGRRSAAVVMSPVLEVLHLELVERARGVLEDDMLSIGSPTGREGAESALVTTASGLVVLRLAETLR